MRMSTLLTGILAFTVLTSPAVAGGKGKPNQNKAPKAAKTNKTTATPNKASGHNGKGKTQNGKGKGNNNNQKGTKTNGGVAASTNPAAKLNKATKKDPRFHEAQSKSNTQLVHAFHVLQRTKVMLQKGNHDYGGNRVGAIQSITAAQSSLRAALGKYGKNIPPAAAGNVKGGKESQKTSNAQLKHALTTINTTITHLANANHDYYGQRAAAVRDLQTARMQLQTALQFAK